MINKNDFYLGIMFQGFFLWIDMDQQVLYHKSGVNNSKKRR